MISIEKTDEKNVEFFLQPNQSASLIANYWLIVLLAIPPLSFALFFFVNGFWLILPFAGLDILILLLLVKYFFKKNAISEQIKFSEYQLEVQKHLADTSSEKYTLPRQWTQIVVTNANSDYHKTTITFRAYGKEIAIGAFLGNQDIQQLLKLFRQQVRLYN